MLDPLYDNRFPVTLQSNLTDPDHGDGDGDEEEDTEPTGGS